MSQTWRIPDVPEIERIKPPSMWIAVFAFIVALVAGFILTILNWKQSESIVSGKFFGFALGVPVLVWGVFCGLLYMQSEDWNNRVDWWNYLCRDNFADWRRWAQWNLSILDTVTITPEAELAERLLGLEGSAPENAGKVLRLPAAETVVATRLEEVLIQLVSPLAETLRRYVRKHTIHIALQSANEAHLQVLRGVLQRLDVPHAGIAMSRFESSELGGILDEWMTNQTVRYDYGYERQKMMPGLCLVLACQLNDDDASPPSSESAVALLFGSWQMLKDAKLRPRARLFRPITTTTDDLADALKTLTTAEPTPLKRLRNLWASNLAKRDGHVVRAITKDSEPPLTLLDLDQALGVSGPVTPLLLPALAAQTVRYGQGPQLVAMPVADGLRLHIIGNEYAPIPSVTEPSLVFWEGSLCAVSGCLVCLWEAFLSASDAGFGWKITPIILGSLMSFVAFPAGAIFKRRTVTRDFFERHACTDDIGGSGRGKIQSAKVPSADL